MNSNSLIKDSQKSLQTLEETYLIFSLHQSLYGIATTVVEEVFFLPELTPIPQAPYDIVGVINLRGTILPVMDLHLRFGYRSPQYKTTDCLVVLRWNETRLGIVVNQVHEVRQISSQEISSDVSYGRENPQEQQVTFKKGIARSTDSLIILLDPDPLINSVERRREHLPQEFLEASTLEELKEEDLNHQREELPLFCPQATPQERKIFQDRTNHLRQSTEVEESHGFKPLAAIRLGGEFFGIDLKIVREFTDIGKITPVPCCPDHIIGNMNLRGEIVTLVDICGLLNLPRVTVSEQLKAMIIEVQGLVVGIIVEEVLDVLLLNPTEITSVPTAIHSIDNEYLEGEATYREKMLSLLAVEKILLQGHLIVDEVI
ncbi:chemotaxis protein CheW [Spirulina sp. CS-785/01]|uniref:chemotaxis protein CheW n=1 Tax=Spirulina sp. CS-785/01 TaxID=3021716 RepID=UPI00232FFF31|nr:chemotaxis protein CheW [Spirulina sp. CS-785/01]MDB9312076.1 chemotaxis protein CheW [Spirulina sp. CS-785/01]